MTLTDYTLWLTKADEKFRKTYKTFKTNVRNAFTTHRKGIVKVTSTKYQTKLAALQLPDDLINESSIHYQRNKVKIKEDHAQGLWLDKEFLCGDTKKKNKNGNIIHLGGHQLYTNFLGEKSHGLDGKKKYIVFQKNQKKVSLIVIKKALSSDGEKALEMFKDMHMHIIINPKLMKLMCKISGWPIAELIKQGFNCSGAKRKYGNEDMTPLGFVQSGRSGKNYYLNKDGEEREFMVENPCSRLSYYSISEIEKMWNDEEFKINEKLGPWDQVEGLFSAYFSDMEKIYLEHMQYFFEPSERAVYSAENMNQVYFGNKFHFSSNLFDQDNSCACHHDTKPKQKGFPSGITAMGLTEDGKRDRFMRHGDGELCFIDLGCNVQYNKGDIVLMDPELYHGILPLKGPRYSLVLYNNRGTL